jgi:hypothetical protein
MQYARLTLELIVLCAFFYAALTTLACLAS